MEEERVRKLKTEVEIRKKDYRETIDELKESLEELKNKDLDRLDKSEREASQDEIYDLVANVSKMAHQLIEAYDKYVKALEDMIPKPDWETP